MAYEIPGFCISAPAGADLSTKQYRLMVMDTNGAVNCPATTAPQVILGVLQNKPTTGTMATVMITGVSKVKVAGTTLSVGEKIYPSSNGWGVKGGTTNAPRSFGFIVDGSSGTSGRIMSVLLMPWATTA